MSQIEGLKLKLLLFSKWTPLAICAVFLLIRPMQLIAGEAWPVRLQLQYFHQFQFAGFYAAHFRGFYEKAGLDVTILEGAPQLQGVTSVVNGQAEFGVSDTELLWKRLRGAPIVALGVIFQNSAYCLVSLNASNIMTLEDLKGKRVGLTKKRGQYLFEALFRLNGLSEDSFQRIEPEWNLRSLIDGKTDVNGAYITGELYQLHEMGLPFQVIYPQDYGIEFYGDTLFTSERYLRDHPDVVERFRRASFEGWRYAFDHPEEVIDHILKFESVRTRNISRERLRYEATVMRHLILPNIIELGSMSAKRWNKMVDQMQLSSPHLVGGKELGSFLYETPAERRRIWQRYALYGAGVIAFLLLLTSVWVVLLRRAVKFRTLALREAVRQAEIHAQEAKDANVAKSLFVASISHEFRTPLTSIIGFSQLLVSTPLSEQQKKWTSIIRARANDLLSLVNQVLELTQLERGKTTQELVDFNLAREIESVVESFAPILQEKAIHFHWRGQEGVEEQVRGAPRALRQVLINLLSNACKFAPFGGHVSLHCGLAPSSDGLKKLYHFTVIDDGPGIPVPMHELVFEAFKQVNEGHQNKDQGSGLGLTISRKLVGALGGEIWIENVQPHGCAVHFTAALSVSQPTSAFQKGHRKILLVDDDSVNRELVRIHLALDGFTITEAATGLDAVKCCEEEKFDFILMDLGLPDIDGIEVAEKIKSDTLSLNRDTPIAALTAAPLHREEERCLKAGMVAFLGKPVNFAELVTTIRQAS